MRLVAHASQLGGNGGHVEGNALVAADWVHRLIVLRHGRVDDVDVDGVAARLQRAAAWRTVLEDVISVEQDAVGEERVHVGRDNLGVGGVVDSEIAPAPVVEQHKDQVGPCGRAGVGSTRTSAVGSTGSAASDASAGSGQEWLGDTSRRRHN